jgi:hypothetical protein
MAKERGWWELETNVEIDDTDRQHIAELIKQGFTSGEIAGDDDILLNDENEISII